MAGIAVNPFPNKFNLRFARLVLFHLLKMILELRDPL